MQEKNDLKILLVDDRKTRQERMLEKDELEMLASLENVTLTYGFSYEPGDIAASDFKLLAFHRTFLMDNGWLDGVVGEVVASSKYLILFGGGISVNMLYESGHVLRMDSADFYSAKTVSFFASLQDSDEADSRDLLWRFLYGNRWNAVLAFKERQAGWLDGKDADRESDRLIKEYVESL